MSELWRLLVLVTLSASAVTFVGSGAIWFMDEERRIRRALRHVLKGAPETVIVAKGRGRGAGFNFSTNQAAVAWDSGAWCLVYRIDEMMGAELSVDGQVIGRVFRGEPRRAIDQIVQQAAQVTLKLIFDDPRHPDFALDLWLDGDQARRETRSPADAIQEANRWLLRADAIVRRPLAPKSGLRGASEPAIASRPPAAPETPRSAPTHKPYTPALEAVSASTPARPTTTTPLFDEIDTTADPMEAPWDDEIDDEPPLTMAEKPYRPVSKATPRPPKGDQDELPFDLDDD